MFPSIDFYPHTFISSRDEPILLEQTLALQISNLSTESFLWKNDTGNTTFNFKPLSDAEPVKGLSMLYLVFPLGEQPGDFTIEDFFSQVEFALPECLLYDKADKNTLVIYPAATITLEPMDLFEILLKRVITTGASGEMVLIHLTYFDENNKIPLGQRALYRTTHPLAITGFSLAKECLPYAFRDLLTFSYTILGAEKSLLAPGDTVLSLQTAEENDSLSINTTLYTPTVYALYAFAKDKMVSQRLECIPREASIVFFRGSYTINPNNTWDVTLQIKVENTRHAYLNRIGRIPVTPGEITKLELKDQQPDTPYILYVENEDGLPNQPVEWIESDYQ